MDVRLLFLVFYGILSTVTSDEFVFPSGDRFTLVNVSTLPDPGLYADVKNTGSLLIDSTQTLEKRLGKNVPVSKFMSKVTGSRYVRAHPVFMKCLQKLIMNLKQRGGIMVDILKGFIMSSESTGSTDDQYLQSGCGAELKIAGGSAGTVTDIAETAFKVCPVIVEREMRDLYVKLMSDRVHVHMAGPEPTGPTLIVQGVNGIADPRTQAQIWTNEGLEPPVDVDCSNFSSLASGQHYPARFSHERVLGNIDVKVTRNMTEFGRLFQYQGTSIEFENSEGTASWCGQEGNTCPSTCTDGIQGNTLNERCADRVMSSRLLSVLNKLQRKAIRALSDKLKVLEAWDEPYDGYSQGDSASDPLHYEGRAVKVTLSDINKLGQLSKYAICAGADYIEHRGTYLYIGAKRYLSGGSKVLFPSMELLEVDVPMAVESDYTLPSAFSEKEKRLYPLFDGSGKLNATLSPDVTVGQFVSKNYRYFRFNPRLHDCYIDIVYHENKRQKATDPRIEIEVVRGYLSNKENSRHFDVINDKRFNRHNLGVALQLKYKGSLNLPDTHTPYRLFKTAIDSCAPKFYQSNSAMGIGLYKDSIFVDMRPKFHMMKQSVNNVPEGVDPDTFEDEVEKRFYLARGGKVVDPENVTSACIFQTAPKPQSPYFKHEHSEIVKRKRRRRRSDDDESCVPTRYTKFCSSTESHRQAVIDDITTSMLDVKQQYKVRSRKEIIDALKGCFGDCGTCLDGEIYFSKVEQCNNFLHWVDWGLLNDKPDVTNFFVRSNRNANIHACEGGNDCIENSPLFSLVAPSVEMIYRPDPKKSVEAELYSVANNPSPVLRLLEDIYAIQASGVVTFWVRDDTEMTALKRQLEVVMLYNKNVTLVQIHVERYRIARDAVKSVVEKAAKSMAMNGCPEVARETLTPYEILEIPAAKKKRAAEPPSLRYQIRDYHKNFEARWGSRHILL